MSESQHPHDTAVWLSGKEVDPAQLDDARLTSYRHPDERRTLISIVATLVIITVILALFGPDLRASLRESLDWVPRGLLGTLLSVVHPEGFVGALAIFLAATAGLGLHAQWLRRAEILSGAAEITPTTFPQHYPVVEELRQRFALPATRVFIYRAAAGLYSFGVRPPHFVVFPSALLGQMTTDEFKFVLGREMGRIKLGHTLLAPLLGGGHLSGGGGGVTAWLMRIRSLLTASYERAQELSCDRIGVLATRSVKPAVDRFIKHEIQPPGGAKVDLDELTNQVAEVNRGLTGLANRLRQLGQAQPDLVFRLLALTQWAGLPRPAEPAPAPGPAPGGAQAPAAAAPGGPGSSGRSPCRGRGAAPTPPAATSTAPGEDSPPSAMSVP
jgi:Zn-dependent protease with chaperone function